MKVTCSQLQKTVNALLLAPLLASLSQPGAQQNNLIYIRGGISLKDHDGIPDNAIGFQIFSGLP
jgi:hypothetical protein